MNTLNETLNFHSTDHVDIETVRSLHDVDAAVKTVLAAMTGSGFGDDSVRRMKTALSETIINAVTHGNRQDLLKKVTVGYTVKPDEARISVLDEGDGFDPRSVPDPTLDENIMKECGRGIYIARNYCDRVEWNESGNRITLVIVNKNGSEA